MSYVLLAPDKFKGSLTASAVAAAIAAGLRAVVPEVEVRRTPVADGGDGTLEAALSAGYERVPVTVAGPLGDPVETAYAVRDRIAVIEMADACGLGRLPGGVLAPLTASSYGLGEVVRAALDGGCREIVLGIGGSASTDGGAGMLTALGARFLDAAGAELPRGGAALARLARVDLSGLHPAVAGATVLVASDVDNPLLGPRGAAAVYGPQKGADAADVELLDAALARYAAVLAGQAADAEARHSDAGGPDAGLPDAGDPDGAHPDAGVPDAGLPDAGLPVAGLPDAGLPVAGLPDAARPDAAHPDAGRPGAGAAGGVGFGAFAVLGATAQPGIELMLDLTGFHELVAGASLVVTGEGSLDTQTLAGKAPAGVAAAARVRGVPVVAVAGRCSLDEAELAAAGIQAAYSLTDIESDPARCMAEAAPLLERLAERVARDWLVPGARQGS